MGRRRVAVAVAVVGGALAYDRLLRPRLDRWGATDDEVTAALVGDDAVPAADGQTTRAITVDAPPEAVWPWIVQIGADRGGFYSYDALENLFGLGIHSADGIVDGWQDLVPGDLVYATRSRTGGWVVVECRPPETLVLCVADVATGRALRRTDPPGWEFGWTFALRRTPDGRTRVLVRERVAFGSPLMRVLMYPVGAVSFLMTQRMLSGIRARAERGS